MSLPASLTTLSHDDLVKLVLAQQRQIAELMAKVEFDLARVPEKPQGPHDRVRRHH